MIEGILAWTAAATSSRRRYGYTHEKKDDAVVVFSARSDLEADLASVLKHVWFQRFDDHETHGGTVFKYVGRHLNQLPSGGNITGSFYLDGKRYSLGDICAGCSKQFDAAFDRCMLFSTYGPKVCCWTDLPLFGAGDEDKSWWIRHSPAYLGLPKDKYRPSSELSAAESFSSKTFDNLTFDPEVLAKAAAERSSRATVAATTRRFTRAFCSGCILGHCWHCHHGKTSGSAIQLLAEDVEAFADTAPDWAVHAVYLSGRTVPKPPTYRQRAVNPFTVVGPSHRLLLDPPKVWGCTPRDMKFSVEVIKQRKQSYEYVSVPYAWLCRVLNEQCRSTSAVSKHNGLKTRLAARLLLDQMGWVYRGQCASYGLVKVTGESLVYFGGWRDIDLKIGPFEWLLRVNRFTPGSLYTYLSAERKRELEWLNRAFSAGLSFHCDLWRMFWKEHNRGLDHLVFDERWKQAVKAFKRLKKKEKEESRGIGTKGAGHGAGGLETLAVNAVVGE